MSQIWIIFVYCNTNADGYDPDQDARIKPREITETDAQISGYFFKNQQKPGWQENLAIRC